MRVTLVAMMGANRVIGGGGLVPWRLPEDMARFKALTWGHPVIMGRRTWDTLPESLPGRENVVLTRNGSWQAEGARAASSLEQALAPYRDSQTEVFVIGGAQVFDLALPLADKLILTVVDESPAGDAFFPEWPAGGFAETMREEREGPPRHAFIRLDRSTERGDR